MSGGLLPMSLDLDGALLEQPSLREAFAATVDLSGLGEALRLRCGKRVAAQALHAIDEARSAHPGPWLTYFGSGDWHHLSLLLLESMRPRRPFSLVLIDNHPDWSCLSPRHHCGNWVSGAARLSALESINILGVDGPDLRPLDLLWAPLGRLASGRIQVFPWARSAGFAPLRRVRGSGLTPGVFGTRLRFSTFCQAGAERLFSDVADGLRRRDVYISIDKDALRSDDAASDWEQGRMSLEELVLGLGVLRDTCNIIGADVCGDRAMRPLHGTIKRLDAGRWGGAWSAPTREEIRKNEAANLAILDALGAEPAPAGGTPTWTRSHG